MCGIFVLVNKRLKILDKNRLSNSIEGIQYRGSDEANTTFISTDYKYQKKFNDNLQIIMSSTRFATQGKNIYNTMPLESEKGNLICFNGDIYNFEDLKNNELGNHKIRSDGDTEIFLNIYEKYNLNFINYLNGDYASVIFDKEKLKLFCFVDYYTTKPLFYYDDSDYFIVSSSINSIESYIGKQDLNNEFVSNFLRYNQWSFSQSDYSIDAYKKIRQISGKEFLEFNLYNKEILKKNNNYVNVNFNKNNFKEIFENSVKIRSISNTKEVNITLSGGLDSSAISLAMSNQDIKQKAFSTENFGDDKKYLNYVLEKNKNIKFEEYKIGNNEDNLDRIKNISKKMRLPSPIYGESLGGYKLFQKIFENNGKCIVLTGHGGDELFGCHDNQFINIFHNYIQNKDFYKSINFLYENFKLKHKGLLIKYFLKFFSRNINIHYRAELNGKIFDLKERQENELFFTNFRQSLLVADFVSMNNNISLRHPMLDKNLRGLVSIPFSEKISPKFDRIILRKYLNNELVKIANRKTKQGMRHLASNIFNKNKTEILESIFYSDNYHISKNKNYIFDKKKKLNNYDKNYLMRSYSLINL